MDTRPTPSNLARLMQDLALREGEDLHRALAESTALFARLYRYEPSRCAPGQGRDVATPERAQRELSLLVARELARLCDLAADERVAEGGPRHGPAETSGDALKAACSDVLGGAGAGDPAPASAPAPGRSEFADRRGLVRRLEEELDCAEAIACLPPPVLERVRDLAWQLAGGERDVLGFRTAAATIEALADGGE